MIHKSDYRLQRGERRRGYSASRLARSHVACYSSSIGGKLPTMSLYSLPLLRDSQSASKPLFTTCGNQSRRCHQRRDSSYGVGRSRRVAWMRIKALNPGVARPNGSIARRRRFSEGSGARRWRATYLLADESTRDDDTHVDAGALRWRRGRGGAWSGDRSSHPSRAGAGPRGSCLLARVTCRGRRCNRGRTHRHERLVERFEHHGVRSLAVSACLRGAHRHSAPLRATGSRHMPISAALEKIFRRSSLVFSSRAGSVIRAGFSRSYGHLVRESS